MVTQIVPSDKSCTVLVGLHATSVTSQRVSKACSKEPNEDDEAFVEAVAPGRSSAAPGMMVEGCCVVGKESLDVVVGDASLQLR